MKIFVAVGPSLDYSHLKMSDAEVDASRTDQMPLDTMASKKGGAGDLMILYGHGSVAPDGTFYIDLFKESDEAETTILDKILLLKKQTGVNNFFIFSCFSGTLINAIQKGVESGAIKLPPDITITAFSSSEHPFMTHKSDGMIDRLIIDNNKGDDVLSDGEIKKLSLKFGVTVKSISGGSEEKKPVVSKYVYHKYPKDYQVALDKKENLRSYDEKLMAEYLNPYEAFEESLSRGKYDRAKEWFDIVCAKQRRDPNTDKSLAEFLLSAHRILFRGLEKHIEEFRKLIFSPKYKKFVNDKNNEGLTMLQSEVDKPNCSLEVLKSLLKAGVDPDIADKNGETAMHRAFYSTNVEAISILLSAGADIHFSVNSGAKCRSPLFSLLNNPDADTEGLKAVLKIFTDNIGDKKFSPNEIEEILEIVSARNIFDETEVLISKISKQVDAAGNNCFHSAIIEDRTEVIELFLQYPILLNVINKKNGSNQTPLMLALESKEDKIAELIFCHLDPIEQIHALNDLSFKGREELGNRLIGIISDNIGSTMSINVNADKKRSTVVSSGQSTKEELLLSDDISKLMTKHATVLPSAIAILRGKIEQLSSKVSSKNEDGQQRL